MNSILLPFLFIGMYFCQSAPKPSPELIPFGAIESDQSRMVITHADVPLYPDIAKAARTSGTIRLDVSVKAGTVVLVKSLTLGPKILVQAARENVKTWRFTPESYGTFNVTYIYEVDNQEVSIPENPRVEMKLPSIVRIVVRPTKKTTLN